MSDIDRRAELLNSEVTEVQKEILAKIDELIAVCEKHEHVYMVAMLSLLGSCFLTEDVSELMAATSPFGLKRLLEHGQVAEKIRQARN